MGAIYIRLVKNGSYTLEDVAKRANSKTVEVSVACIIEGYATIDDVPTKYKEDVQAQLIAEGYDESGAVA